MPSMDRWTTSDGPPLVRVRQQREDRGLDESSVVPESDRKADSVLDKFNTDHGMAGADPENGRYTPWYLDVNNPT